MKTKIIPFDKAVKQLKIGKFAVIDNPEKNILKEALNIASSNNHFEKSPVSDIFELTNLEKSIKDSQLENNFRSMQKISLDMYTRSINMII